MNTRLDWSLLRPLTDRKGLPNKAGVYLIGVIVDHQLLGSSENGYYGDNYPLGFHPRYVGMTVGTTSGISVRLRAHARGRGNRQIRNEILAGRITELYYTYSLNDLGDAAESIILRHRASGFLDWNNKSERTGYIMRSFREGDPPEPILCEDFSPEEQLEEIRYKKWMAENWETVRRQPAPRTKK